MNKLWTWIKSKPKWLLFPALAMAISALWVLFRPRPCPRASLDLGYDPKTGEDHIREIRTATQTEKNRIREHSEAKRREISGKWGGSLCLLLCVALAASACAGGVHRPDAPPWPGTGLEPSLALSRGCEYDETGELAICPAGLFAGQLLAIADLEDSWAMTTRDLVEARAVGSIRESIALARVRAAEDRVEDARRARWFWALGGTAVGVAAAGLFMGLAR